MRTHFVTSVLCSNTLEKYKMIHLESRSQLSLPTCQHLCNFQEVKIYEQRTKTDPIVFLLSSAGSHYHNG